MAQKKLTNYNAKIDPAVKELLGAIVDVGPLGSQRELLEHMLTAYEKEQPETVGKAKQLLQLKGIEIEEPIEGGISE